MESFILLVHVLVALALIGLVLIQQGKGAEAGAGFVGGGADSLFGSKGSGSFLTRITTWLAIAFFLTSLGLAHLSVKGVNGAQEIAPLTIEQQLGGQTESPVGDVPRVPSAPIPAE